VGRRSDGYVDIAIVSEIFRGIEYVDRVALARSRLPANLSLNMVP
jgi:hypothetical protein